MVAEDTDDLSYTEKKLQEHCKLAGLNMTETKYMSVGIKNTVDLQSKQQQIVRGVQKYKYVIFNKRGDGGDEIQKSANKERKSIRLVRSPLWNIKKATYRT